MLADELHLYKTLLETENLPEKIAEKLLNETKDARHRLDEKSIFGTQSQLIANVNKKVGKNIWGTFVPNFKSLATVSAIFSSKTGVKQKVLFEQALVDRMSQKKALGERSHMAPLDNLTYASFIEKFNNKYGDLLQEQKDLLNRYITSFADDGFELRLYLNEELGRLMNALQECPPEEAPLIVEKTKEVIEYLGDFRKREFVDQDLKKILKTQELVQELKDHDHN